jgi:hypothetical protein
MEWQACIVVFSRIGSAPLGSLRAEESVGLQQNFFSQQTRISLAPLFTLHQCAFHYQPGLFYNT